MRSIAFVIGSLVVVGAAAQQISINRPVVLTGAATEQRQVLGLAPSMGPWDLQSGAVEQDGSHRYGTTTGQAVWQTEIAGLAGAPTLGTHLLLLPTAAPIGDAQLVVNGHGPYPLTLGGDSAFSENDWRADMVLSLVFDGTGFQVMNGSVHTPRECPDGMIAVNEHFCIDLQEHPIGVPFLDACLACGEEGKRVCGWSEFYIACINRAAIGVPDMIGDREWTGDTANFGARVVDARTSCNGAVGAGNINTNNFRFHCCLSR